MILLITLVFPDEVVAIVHPVGWVVAVSHHTLRCHARCRVVFFCVEVGEDAEVIWWGCPSRVGDVRC